MKSKLYLAIAFVALVLLSVQCKKSAGVKTEPMYCNMFIDLKPFYPADTLMKMNLKLYNAAISGEITGYQSDSLLSKFTKEEILNKGGSEEAIQKPDPKSKLLIDSIVRVPFNPKDIKLNCVNFLLKYDEVKRECQVVFTGFAPCFSLIVAGQNLGIATLFNVSKEDLVKLFGQKETTALFANCYKAFLKAINNDKTIEPVKTTFFYTNINEYLGQNILDGVNKKMYDAVTKGYAGTAPLPAYQSDDFSKIFTAEEVLNRGGSLESVQMPLNQNDPNSLMIDTVIMNPFRTEGNKLYSLSFEWKYDAEKMEAYPKINAFGIALSYEKDKKPAHNTLFWFDWKNANKIYTPFEESLLKYSFFKALGNYSYSHL
jgi:hypothetical protein